MAANVANDVALKREILSLRILIGIFLFFTSAVLNAQEENRFKFGLKVSPSINWMQTKTSTIDSRGAVVNLNYGLTTDFAIKGSDKYFISSGITVLSNGGKLNYVGVENVNDVLFESNNEVDITTRYIEIPLGLKLRSNEIGYSIFSGWFGFGTGFRVDAFQQRNTSWQTVTGNQQKSIDKENIDDKINPVRFSLVIGVEWERKISKNTFFTFGLTFNNGLSNVLSGNSYGVSEQGRLDWSTVNSDGSPNGSKLKATSKTIALNLGIYF